MAVNTTPYNLGITTNNGAAEIIRERAAKNAETAWNDKFVPYLLREYGYDTNGNLRTPAQQFRAFADDWLSRIAEDIRRSDVEAKIAAIDEGTEF